MRNALLPLAVLTAALALTACGGPSDAPSDGDQARAEAAARDADKAPLTPEQDRETAAELQKDLESWK